MITEKNLLELNCHFGKLLLVIVIWVSVLFGTDKSWVLIAVNAN